MIPEISVVIPVYNVENYLNRCINSIINQTFKNIEIILINDGSTDNSGNICDKYKLQDNRVTVIHQENKGLSNARNTGIKNAKGKYISLIDSDDWVDITMLESQYNLIKKKKADICECRFIKCTDEGKAVQPKEEIVVLDGYESCKSLYKNSYYGSIISCNKLYKRSLFNKIKFPEGRLNEDQFTTPKLYLESKTIVFTNQIYYYYYQSSNSITRSKFSLKKLDALDSLRETKEMYKQYNLDELYMLIDETYSYALLKYYNLIPSNYRKIKNEIFKEYKVNLINFIMNKYIPYKYKIYLLLFRINPKLFNKIME